MYSPLGSDELGTAKRPPMGIDCADWAIMGYDDCREGQRNLRDCCVRSAELGRLDCLQGATRRRGTGAGMMAIVIGAAWAGGVPAPGVALALTGLVWQEVQGSNCFEQEEANLESCFETAQNILEANGSCP